jgi:hypothetical protein
MPQLSPGDASSREAIGSTCWSCVQQGPGTLASRALLMCPKPYGVRTMWHVLLQEQCVMADIFCGAGHLAVGARSAGWAVSRLSGHVAT